MSVLWCIFLLVSFSFLLSVFMSSFLLICLSHQPEGGTVRVRVGGVVGQWGVDHGTWSRVLTYLNILQDSFCHSYFGLGDWESSDSTRAVVYYAGGLINLWWQLYHCLVYGGSPTGASLLVISISSLARFGCARPSRAYQTGVSTAQPNAGRVSGFILT